jgi:hypothetical protein
MSKIDVKSAALGGGAVALVAMVVLALTGARSADVPQTKAIAADLGATVACTGVYSPDGSVHVDCPPAIATSPSPTSTPTATPTATPTSVPPTTVPPTTVPPTTTLPAQQNNCLPVPSACGFPDDTNTGPAAGTLMETTSVVLTRSGTYDHVQFNGCVEVRAANVVITNSVVNGNGCFYAVRNFSTNLRIDHSEITCGDTSGTAVTADNYTVTFSDVHGCENGFNVNSNVVVSDSWIHGLFFGPGAHTDGAQFSQGGGPITFRHNTIRAGTSSNSAIIMWDEGDPQNHDVLIQNNILAEGGFTLYCGRMNSTNVRIVQNRFVPGFYDYANSCTPGHVLSWTGNVIDRTGATAQAK